MVEKGTALSDLSDLDFLATAALSEPRRPDLSIRIICECERAKAGWPLASTVAGVCWS